jgi:hypothetical protein
MAFLLPYLAFIGLLYVAATRRPAMVAVHMVLLGLVSHLLLVLDFVLHPDPPFSQPPARASRTRSTLISIVAAIAVGTTLPLVLGPVYASPAATGLTLAGLAVLNALAHLGLRARLGAIA